MKRMSFGFILSFFVLGAGVLSASENKAVESAIEPKAEEIVKNFSDYLLSLKTFRVEISTSIKTWAEGMNQEFTSTSDIAVQRPNMAAIVLKKGMMGATIICDGKDVYTYIPAMKKYTVEESPEKLELLESMKFGAGGPFPVAASLVSQDPQACMLEGVTAGKYLGVEDLNGTRCHHLHFEQENFDWDAWFEAGDGSLIRKICPDMNKTFLKLSGNSKVAPLNLKSMRHEMTISLDNWFVNTALPAEQFVFKAPEDAQKVDSLMPQRVEKDKKSSLAGKPAPAFTLKTADGGEFDISSFKDKNAVVLDFWATWCPPCRKSFPLIAKVAESYKNRGLIFCAVNQGEDVSKVKEFLDKQGIECVVALDVGSHVGRLYQVPTIPFTVLIGKNGVVEAVHAGFSPNLEEVLKDEIEKLLEDKPLLKDEN